MIDLEHIKAYYLEPTDPTGEPHPSWQWLDAKPCGRRFCRYCGGRNRKQ